MITPSQITLNDFFTAASFFIASAVAIYQIQHYRSQSPNLNISNITDAKYGRVSDYEGDRTRYDIEMKVENSGREATTVSSAMLRIEDTNEELTLQRMEGSTKVPIAGDAPPNLPSEVDSEIRIPGNDVAQIKYRAEGSPREDYSNTVNGQIELQTAGSDKCRSSVVFVNRYSESNS